jgi:hypothetical protein
MTIRNRDLVNVMNDSVRVEYSLMNRILDGIVICLLISLFIGFIIFAILTLAIWFITFPFQLLYDIYHIEAHD